MKLQKIINAFIYLQKEKKCLSKLQKLQICIVIKSF